MSSSFRVIDDTLTHYGIPAPEIHPFAVVQDGSVVIEERDNGSATYMTYRQRRHAEKRLDEVRRQLRDAEVIDRTQP